jgi:hypothetical protein
MILAMVKSFRDVIGLWKTPEALASEIGVSHWAAYKWRHRNTIPAEWWFCILRTETARKHGVNAEMLTKFASGKGLSVREAAE